MIGHRDMYQSLSQTSSLEASALMSSTDCDRASPPILVRRRVAIAASFTADPVAEALNYWMTDLDLPWSIELRPTTRCSSSCSIPTVSYRGTMMASTSSWSGSKTGCEPARSSRIVATSKSGWVQRE